MPSSRKRHRVEIDGRLYDGLLDLAAREGYTISRFADKLLFLAMQDYIEERKRGRHPFAGAGLERIDGVG